MSRSKGPNPETKRRDTPGLVESQPMLHSISEARETKASIVDEVGEDVFLGKPPAVSIVQLGRKIPVILEEGIEVLGALPRGCSGRGG